MPAMAREPSGTLVEVLCGQPEQNQGVRSAAGGELASADSRAAKMARCASMRAAVASSAPRRLSRAAMALAIRAGVRSALARSSVCALGLGTLHSPPL